MRDILSIDTPENVTFGYEVAGIGSRVVAYGLDFIFRWTPFLALLLIFFLAGFVFQDLLELGTAMLIVMGVAFIALHMLYFIVFEAWMRGQTPGKRLAGIRVVMDNGRPAPMAPIIARNLMRLIDSPPPLGHAIGLIVMFVNRKSQRLGDLVAGTVAVKERAYSKKSVEELGYALREYNEPSVELGVLLGHEEYELVQRYLTRLPTLASERRDALGKEILEAVLARQSASAAQAVRALAAREGARRALHEMALHFAREHQ